MFRVYCTAVGSDAALVIASWPSLDTHTPTRYGALRACSVRNASPGLLLRPHRLLFVCFFFVLVITLEHYHKHLPCDCSCYRKKGRQRETVDVTVCVCGRISQEKLFRKRLCRSLKSTRATQTQTKKKKMRLRHGSNGKA